VKVVVYTSAKPPKILEKFEIELEKWKEIKRFVGLEGNA